MFSKKTTTRHSFFLLCSFEQLTSYLCSIEYDLNVVLHVPFGHKADLELALFPFEELGLERVVAIFNDDLEVSFARASGVN